MKFKFIISILAAALIFLPGCLDSSNSSPNNQKSNPNPDKELQPLSVMLYSIDDKSDDIDTNISIQPKIRLKFSESISLEYLDRTYIDVYSTDVGYIEDIKYSFVDDKHKIVELSFPKPLGSLQKYYINISKNIVDVNGINLARNMTYNFITTEVENKKVGFVINNSIDKNKVPLEQAQLKFQFADDIISSGIRPGDIKLYKGDLDPSNAIDLTCTFDPDNSNYNCPLNRLDSDIPYYVIFDNVLDSQKHQIFGRFSFHSSIAAINTKPFGINSGNLSNLYNVVDKQGNIYVVGVTDSSALYIAKFSSGLLKRWDTDYKPKTTVSIDSKSIFVTNTQILIVGFDEDGLPIELFTIDKNNGVIKYDDNVNKLFDDKLRPNSKIKQLVFDKLGNAYVLSLVGDGYPILTKFNMESEVVKQWETPLTSIDLVHSSVKDSLNMFVDNRISVPSIYIGYYYKTSDNPPPYAYSKNLDNSNGEPYMLFGLIVVNLSNGEMNSFKNKVQDYSALDFRLDSYYGYDQQMFYVYHDDAEQKIVNTGRYKTDSFRLARDSKYIAKSVVINDMQNTVWVGGYNYTDDSKKTSYAFLQKCDNINAGVVSCNEFARVPAGVSKGIVQGQQVSYSNNVVVLTGVSDTRFNVSEQNLGISSSDGVGFITVVAT